MMPEDKDNELLEPPRYDMLIIRFRGDQQDIILPYCEVANGELSGCEEEEKVIEIAVEGKPEMARISFDDFIKHIEKTFDIKEIKKLAIQPAGSSEAIQIL
jgi:hypothetical protein